MSLFLLATALAHAEDLLVPSPSCKCETTGLDEREGPGQFNFGRYFGLCVDTCRYRKSHAEVSDHGRLARISNFMHEGKYWTAEIPLAKVQKVQVGFEEFRAGLFHVFLVFHFEQGYPLVSQVRRNAGQARTLVISPEGVPPKTGRYSLIDAYLERYPIGIRAVSVEQFREWSVEKLGHPVELYDLKINAAQARELLLVSLEALNRKSFQTRYRLLSENCATNVLDLIDAVIKPKFSFYQAWLYQTERALPIAGPFGTRAAFLTRELIEKGARL